MTVHEPDAGAGDATRANDHAQASDDARATDDAKANDNGKANDDPRSGEQTRLKLIAAARDIFAREGYRGATIRAITREVGVNVGAVTYHFGSKEDLYHEVLRDVLAPLRDRVLAASSADGSTRERIERVMRAVFEHLLENPDQPRFMIGIRMGEDAFPPIVVEFVGPVVMALTTLIQQGQAEGLIRSGAPTLFVLSMLSQPIYFSIAARRAPAGVIPADPASPEGREVLLDHMVSFALGGLAPDRRSE